MVPAGTPVLSGPGHPPGGGVVGVGGRRRGRGRGGPAARRDEAHVDPVVGVAPGLVAREPRLAAGPRHAVAVTRGAQLGVALGLAEAARRGGVDPLGPGVHRDDVALAGGELHAGVEADLLPARALDRAELRPGQDLAALRPQRGGLGGGGLRLARLVVAHAHRGAGDLGLEAHPDLALGAAADLCVGGLAGQQPDLGGLRLLRRAAVGGQGRLLDEREGAEDGGEDEDGYETTSASEQDMAGRSGRCGGAHRGRHGEPRWHGGRGRDRANGGGGRNRGVCAVPGILHRDLAGRQGSGGTSPKCAAAG